jgi:hypothetical protein
MGININIDLNTVSASGGQWERAIASLNQEKIDEIAVAELLDKDVLNADRPRDTTSGN